MRWKPGWLEMIEKASRAIWEAGEDWSSISAPAFKESVATSVTGDILSLLKAQVCYGEGIDSIMNHLICNRMTGT